MLSSFIVFEMVACISTFSMLFLMIWLCFIFHFFGILKFEQSEFETLYIFFQKSE